MGYGTTVSTPVSRQPVEPKQDRARETRTRLLDAALAELVQHGYGRLTTSGVARRAGVSRGAQQNYFPHKRVLVAEAVHHLSRRQIEELNTRVAQAPLGPDRLHLALDILFELYSGPLFAAMIELSLASHSESEVRAVVATAERAISQAIHETASRVVGPDAARAPQFADRWVMALSTVRGLALLKVLGHSVDVVDRQWDVIRGQLIELCEGALVPLR